MAAKVKTIKSSLQTMLPQCVGLLWLLVGCHPNKNEGLPPNKAFISRDQLKDDWPFTVESGVLGCVANPLSPGMPAVVFTTGDVTYGINGGALTGDVFPRIDPIMAKTSIGLYKVNLGDMISRGLDLCKFIDEANRPVVLGR
jgi:hypothetical protein